MRRALITGAGGRIGSSLANQLGRRYQLRLHYFPSAPERPPTGDYLVADITQFEQIAQAMEGVEAVVHLAGNPNEAAAWEEVHPANIVGCYHVFEAARQAGVRRLVFASSNHVMGMYDRDRSWPVYGHQPIRPDSLYGVSKAFGEALGRYYHDEYGLSVICLRIGWFLPRPTEGPLRNMWLSPRDCAQLVSRAIESNVGFGIFYGISDNKGRHWDITDAVDHLGYRPEDDAEREGEPK
jgi:NAD+ dependent glucose-6-phosphate dehydrogenase